MREILFRAKRDERYGNPKEWVYGVPYTDIDDDWIIATDYSKRVVQENTIGEYTGITDKSGNKVFEGDILHIEKENFHGVVRYGRYCNPFNDDPDRRHVGFYVEWNDRPELLRRDLAFWCSECNVVGNIFDNSELLKGE